MTICLVAMYRLEKSRLGTTFASIASSDLLAGSIGVNARWYRVYMFTISAFFTGLAGALLAHYLMVISPHSFGLGPMLAIMIWAIVGGAGSFAGPIIGIVVLSPGVAGKPENVAVALILQQVHDLGRAVMAVATHRDLDPGPMAPDAADDVAQDPRRLVTGWPLARTQQRQHRLGGRRVEDVDGLKAVLIVMGVEQCQLLAAVDGIRGIVNVEHDVLGHALEAVAKQIDHRQPPARQFAP